MGRPRNEIVLVDGRYRGLTVGCGCEGGGGGTAVEKVLALAGVEEQKESHHQ